MKTLIVTLLASLLSVSAFAGCTGYGNYRTCYDSKTGNQVTTNTIGNTTYTTGRNSRTGSTWSQNTNRFGNQTIVNGRDSNGQSWNSTYHGNGTSYHRDSNGNSKTCYGNKCY